MKITDDPEAQHYIGADAFSPDGTKIAFSANTRTRTDMETWVRDRATGETRSVFGEGKYSLPGPWSPDGAKLVALDFRNNSDSSIYVVDLESGEATEVTPHEEETLYVPGPWALDGSGFYVLTDEGREFRGLAFYGLAAGQLEWIETPEADIEEVTVSGDGRVLAWLVNEDGWERLRLRDLATDRDLPDPELPPGARPHLTGFLPPVALSHDGSQAAVILSGPRRPADVWVADTATGRARALTESRIGVPQEEALVDVELVSYPTFDGRDIPAWLYRPEVDGRVPVVLSIHGLA